MVSLRIVALVVAFFIANNVAAQGDFFFSFATDGPNSDQTAEYQVGDTGSLWVYWSTNGPANSDLSVGAFIDVMSSTSGVVEFTAAKTYDYAVVAPGLGGGHRYLNQNGLGGFAGPAESVTSNFIDELAAFTVTGGPGILEFNNCTGVFCDDGYEPDNDGFQWGRIDFNVVGSGSTTVTGMAGDGLIVHEDHVVDATFTTATINVASSIPEPSAIGLICVGIAGIAIRRNR